MGRAPFFARKLGGRHFTQTRRRPQEGRNQKKSFDCKTATATPFEGGITRAVGRGNAEPELVKSAKERRRTTIPLFDSGNPKGAKRRSHRKARGGEGSIFSKLGRVLPNCTFAEIGGAQSFGAFMKITPESTKETRRSSEVAFEEAWAVNLRVH